MPQPAPGEHMVWTLRQRLLAALLVIFWVVVAPATFVLLYLVLDLQLASRTAEDAREDISEYVVFQAAGRLTDIDTQLDAHAADGPPLWAALLATRRTFDAARSDLRAGILDYTSSYNLPLDPKSCPADWPQLSECYDSVRVFVGKQPRAAGAPDDKAVKDFEAVKAAATTVKRAVLNYNAASARWNERDAAITTLTAARGAELKKWGPGVSSQAETLMALRQALPIVGWLYLLPFGVVVAFFTAFMGAVGGVAASLSKDLKARTSAGRIQSDLTGLYLINPAMGLVSGFMVFFVVSTGAIVLVQPGGGGETAIDRLSPAALAAMGVLAGLAAEAAVASLTDRARSFFQKDKDSVAPHRPPAGAHDPAPVQEPPAPAPAPEGGTT